MNTVRWICGLRMRTAVSSISRTQILNVWPWVAVAVHPDLQFLRWVYVQLLRPWMLATDVYFASWLWVGPSLLGTAPHQTCTGSCATGTLPTARPGRRTDRCRLLAYCHRKRLLKVAGSSEPSDFGVLYGQSICCWQAAHREKQCTTGSGSCTAT